MGSGVVKRDYALETSSFVVYMFPVYSLNTRHM